MRAKAASPFVQSASDALPSPSPWWCCRSVSLSELLAIAFIVILCLVVAILAAIGMYVGTANESHTTVQHDHIMAPFSIPTACRALSLISLAIIVVAYMLKPSVRSTSIPLVLPLMLSQGGYLVSRLYIAVSKTFSGQSIFKLGTPLIWYCGEVSSTLTTTMNLMQIFFTVAITYRLYRSVAAPPELLVDTKVHARSTCRLILCAFLLSLTLALTVTFSTIPSMDPDFEAWAKLVEGNSMTTPPRYSPWTCMSTETQTLNNLYAPFIGLGLVTFLAFRIKAKVQGLYPTHARRSIKSVANYYIGVYVLTWGGSLFVYAVLIVSHQTPGWSPPNGVPTNDENDRLARVMRVSLAFIPYDLQGFLTCVVTIWSFFRIRWRFDLGLSLKAIRPTSIEFDEPLEVLGQGAFAIVVKAMWYPSRTAEHWYCCHCRKSSTSSSSLLPTTAADGIPVAVKTFRFERDSTHVTLNGVQEEAYLASQLVHPNVMATYGCYTSGSHLYLVCEYLGGGTLQDVLAPDLPYVQVLQYALMIASGMAFLHTLDVPVIHRDLKPLNCVFDQTRSVLKLVDFGLSRLFHEDEVERKLESITQLSPHSQRATFSASRSNLVSLLGHHSEEVVSLTMTSRVGTVCWAAPELLVDQELSTYSLKVDVYSFGIICWQLMTGRQPYDDIPGSALASCPPHFAKLMRFAWHSNPHRRPSFPYIVKLLNAELDMVTSGSWSSAS
ncbi:TKL/MLK/MLK protein kinase [Saprolegnia parasitica CBS 223.65]|uniref:TKL/MLK/MLK protein kinase n=1 Tax=Saprolegnia parasitica (strain CBS 223.65) TaxID=695850 RepID=A0A067CIQ4_SAPPC|nr:TKL/MLK/MLK protein kinase [Saprolegnia parasitica CBS 223.65]KDO30609.1 TKL/MLK/MLK protein kinase [Saprolegnia parasitica CBS 223.65]|eukprot:XP_012198820.1 TKL/MLK/MLK protein kinase [Saprolegnia parasitica CBS 223.65]